MEGGETNLVLTFIGQLINFVILFVLLKIFVFKPFSNILEKRREKIKAGVEKEEKAEKKMQSLREVEENMKKRNEEERREILSAAEEDVKKRKEKTLEALNEVKKEVLLKAEKEAENIKKQKQEQSKKEIVENSISLAEKILKEKIGKDQNTKIINDYLNNLK